VVFAHLILLVLIQLDVRSQLNTGAIHSFFRFCCSKRSMSSVAASNIFVAIDTYVVHRHIVKISTHVLFEFLLFFFSSFLLTGPSVLAGFLMQGILLQYERENIGKIDTDIRFSACSRFLYAECTVVQDILSSASRLVCIAIFPFGDLGRRLDKASGQPREADMSLWLTYCK
jgi:hypothetical protein